MKQGTRTSKTLSTLGSSQMSMGEVSFGIKDVPRPKGSGGRDDVMSGDSRSVSAIETSATPLAPNPAFAADAFDTISTNKYQNIVVAADNASNGSRSGEKSHRSTSFRSRSIRENDRDSMSGRIKTLRESSPISGAEEDASKSKIHTTMAASQKSFNSTRSKRDSTGSHNRINQALKQQAALRSPFLSLKSDMPENPEEFSSSVKSQTKKSPTASTISSGVPVTLSSQSSRKQSGSLSSRAKTGSSAESASSTEALAIHQLSVSTEATSTTSSTISTSATSASTFTSGETWPPLGVSDSSTVSGVTINTQSLDAVNENRSAGNAKPLSTKEGEITITPMFPSERVRSISGKSISGTSLKGGSVQSGGVGSEGYIEGYICAGSMEDKTGASPVGSIEGRNAANLDEDVKSRRTFSTHTTHVYDGAENFDGVKTVNVKTFGSKGDLKGTTGKDLSVCGKEGGGGGLPVEHIFKDPEPLEVWRQFKNLNCGARYTRDKQGMFACYPILQQGDSETQRSFVGSQKNNCVDTNCSCLESPLLQHCGNSKSATYPDKKHLNCKDSGECAQFSSRTATGIESKCKERADYKFGVKRETVVSGFDSCGLPPNQNGATYAQTAREVEKGNQFGGYNSTLNLRSSEGSGCTGKGGKCCKASSSEHTTATRRTQNCNVIPLNNHAMYIQMAGHNDIDSLKREFFRLSAEYDTFSQQQTAFVAALEDARQCEMRSVTKSATAEIKNVEQVEQYVLDRYSNHAVHLRIARMFVCLHASFEDYYFKLKDYFDRTFNGAAKKLVDTREAQTLLTRLKDFMDKRFNFFDLRVDYPHHQVYRLGVDEARRHFGGAVSYLPIALEIMACARKELTKLTQQLEQGVDEDPPIVKTVPKQQRPVVDFIKKNKKLVDTADLAEKLRILNGRYCSQCTLPRRAKGGDCFPFESERPWKGAGRHGWNYSDIRYCACSDFNKYDNVSSFCARSCR